MERMLDLTPGSVSILGLMNDKEKVVKLLVDEDVVKAVGTPRSDLIVNRENLLSNKKLKR